MITESENLMQITLTMVQSLSLSLRLEMLVFLCSAIASYRVTVVNVNEQPSQLTGSNTATLEEPKHSDKSYVMLLLSVYIHNIMVYHVFPVCTM